MKYFMAIYMMPVAGLDGWMAKPESERKEAEEKMRSEWDAWTEKYKANIKNSIALGKTKRVDAKGASDARNGFMISTYVEAESLDAAAEIFKDHPHLSIPEATIEIMETRAI